MVVVLVMVMEMVILMIADGGIDDGGDEGIGIADVIADDGDVLNYGQVEEWSALRVSGQSWSQVNGLDFAINIITITITIVGKWVRLLS